MAGGRPDANMSFNRFNKDKDELLIELVRCQPEIYDPSHSNYKNVVNKHKSWENISETLGISISDVKKRWKNIRDHYMKKIKAVSCTGQARSESNSWEYMSQLTFLSQAPTQKDTVTNVTILKEEIEIEENAVFEESVNIENTPSTSHMERPDQSDTRLKRKRKTTHDNSLANILEKRQEERPAIYSKLSSEEKSPIHKFFDSMADIVAGFPPNLVAKTRLKVLQAVNEIESEMYNQPMPPNESDGGWVLSVENENSSL